MSIEQLVKNGRLAALLLLLADPVSCPAADGHALSLHCMTCHAVSNAQIPALNGRSTQTLKSQLLDFKYDRAKVTLMNRLAKGYSDEELAAIAQYLGEASRNVKP